MPDNIEKKTDPNTAALLLPDDVPAPPAPVVASDEIIYASPPSNPDDDLWLEQGRKLATESLANVRAAATELLKAVGMLQTIYLGLLGFADIIPKTLDLQWKLLFVTPAVPWLGAIYYCLRVLMTEEFTVNLYDVNDVKALLTELAGTKQSHLQAAFAMLGTGLVLALLLLVFRATS